MSSLGEEAAALERGAAASLYEPPEDLPGDESARLPQPNSEGYWKSLLEEER